MKHLWNHSSIADDKKALKTIQQNFEGTLKGVKTKFYLVPIKFNLKQLLVANLHDIFWPFYLIYCNRSTMSLKSGYCSPRED